LYDQRISDETSGTWNTHDGVEKFLQLIRKTCRSRLILFQRTGNVNTDLERMACEDVDGIHPVQDRDQRQTVMKAIPYDPITKMRGIP
jgi:hypothetical protein